MHGFVHAGPRESRYHKHSHQVADVLECFDIYFPSGSDTPQNHVEEFDNLAALLPQGHVVAKGGEHVLPVLEELSGLVACGIALF